MRVCICLVLGACSWSPSSDPIDSGFDSEFDTGPTAPDTTPPILGVSKPENDELTGVSEVPLQIMASDDRSEVLTLEVLVDGQVVDTHELAGCLAENGRCSTEVSLLTETWDEESHLVEVRATDRTGNATTERPGDGEVRSSTILYVSAYSGPVNRDSDFGGYLEVEVHLFDTELDTFLGCAPMRKVQKLNTPYEMAAPFANGSSFMDPESVSGAEVDLLVIESDNQEHCPSAPDFTSDLYGRGDDLLLKFAPVDGPTVRDGALDLRHGEDGLLRIERGRPYAYTGG